MHDSHHCILPKHMLPSRATNTYPWSRAAANFILGWKEISLLHQRRTWRELRPISLALDTQDHERQRPPATSRCPRHQFHRGRGWCARCLELHLRPVDRSQFTSTRSFHDPGLVSTAGTHQRAGASFGLRQVSNFMFGFQKPPFYIFLLQKATAIQ
jgi:hypothetical protein